MTNTVTYPDGTWVNADGLPVRFGKTAQIDAVVGKPTQYGVEQSIEVDLVWDRLPAFTADEAHGQIYGGYPSVAIPAGALIKSATMQTTTAFGPASSQTLSIGLVTANGTEIDNDGFFDAVAQTSMDAVGESVTGAGALIGTKLATTGYLWATVQTATFTSGRARVNIVYYMPPTDSHNS